MKRYILLITILICILCTGCTTKNNNNDTSETDSNTELIRINRYTIEKYLIYTTTAKLSFDKDHLIYEVVVNCIKPYIVAEEITLKINVSFEVMYYEYQVFDPKIESELYSEDITIKLKPNKTSATYKDAIEIIFDIPYYQIVRTIVKSSKITLATGYITK